MKRPTFPRLATTLAIPGGLLIAGVWLVLWACRCRHRESEDLVGPEGNIIRICSRCGEEVENA